MPEKPFNDFHSAWQWLLAHPRMKSRHGNSHFDKYLYIMVVKVDPATECIEDRDRNTATRVWLECCVSHHGEGDWDDHRLDHDLDCGAATFEEAIQELATLVLQKYGE